MYSILMIDILIIRVRTVPKDPVEVKDTKAIQEHQYAKHYFLIYFLFGNMIFEKIML